MKQPEDSLFYPHQLNDTGIDFVTKSQNIFATALDDLKKLASKEGHGAREFAEVKTCMQTASFYMSRSIALNPKLQQK